MLFVCGVTITREIVTKEQLAAALTLHPTLAKEDRG